MDILVHDDGSGKTGHRVERSDLASRWSRESGTIGKDLFGRQIMDFAYFSIVKVALFCYQSPAQCTPWQGGDCVIFDVLPAMG